jgi:hypothetical protein
MFSRAVGCKQEYDPSQNTSDLCHYHPGGPIFHEGLKGWSCCSKKVTDFDSFLKIPGCAQGSHSDVVVKEAASKSLESLSINESKPAKDISSAPPNHHTQSDAQILKETFQAPSLEVKAPGVPLNSTRDMDSNPTDLSKQEPEFPDRDPLDAVIPVGSVCKRRGCGAKYVDSNSTTEACTHHPGQPIFHEGSKGWTCCTRRVLEFDVFLRLAGCKTVPHHVFLAPPSSVKVETLPAARTDWYQTRDSVIMSIFVKGVKEQYSEINMEQGAIHWRLCTDEANVMAVGSTIPFLPIVPEKSQVTYLSTKVELTLVKMQGISWPVLEKSEKLPPVNTWTTFGATGGSGGTVGGQVMDVASDAPIYAAP